jgi:hypothetical protein
MDYLKSVSHYSYCLDFFTSVSSVKLHGTNKPFYNRTKCLSEFFGLISARGVGNEDLGFDGFGSDIILEAWVFSLLLG